MRPATPGRRSFLVGCASLVGGCLGGPSAATGEIPDETDGYPPPFDSQPDRRVIDTDSFGTTTVAGTAVSLAPIDVAYYWYQRREARFADARGKTSYELTHVLGAVHSPAPDGGDADPIQRWPRDDRIVCYCGCPHHLASIRAATLLENGYSDVHVIDEGYWEWRERKYPIAGRAVSTEPPVHEIDGRTDPAFAGQSVWAWHEPSGQREATAIDETGRFVLELRFTGITMDSIIFLDTPAYDVRASLRSLIRGSVADDATYRP